MLLLQPPSSLHVNNSWVFLSVGITLKTKGVILSYDHWMERLLSVFFFFTAFVLMHCDIFLVKEFHCLLFLTSSSNKQTRSLYLMLLSNYLCPVVYLCTHFCFSYQKLVSSEYWGYFTSCSDLFCIMIFLIKGSAIKFSWDAF